MSRENAGSFWWNDDSEEGIEFQQVFNKQNMSTWNEIARKDKQAWLESNSLNGFKF